MMFLSCNSQSNTKRSILVIMVALLLFGLGSPLYANTGTPSSLVNRRAPNFSRMDLNHRQANLADYRGKVVLLNFWATWCGPCLTEMPQFVAWQREYGEQGLQVIGVSMDDDAQPVRAVSRKYRLNYPVIMGDERIGELYGGIFGLPVTFLIDRNGKIRFKHQGAADLSKIQSEIQTLLSRK